MPSPSFPPRQHRVVLARPLEGVPMPDDFRIEDVAIPPLDRGACLARVVYLSLDPYLRSAIAGRHIGHAATGVGDLVPGRSIAQVVASRRSDLREGEYVEMESGWQEFVTTSGPVARRLDPTRAPLASYLGALGMPGLTAWVAVTRLLRLAPGQTLAVSAPLGAVGSTALQLGKLAGCRTVGVTSTLEKCTVARDALGLEACVAYREAGWGAALAAACPDGIHGYLDNAGGEILDTVLGALATGGRVVLCGLMDQYNTGRTSRVALAPLIVKRATLTGLVVYDHMADLDAFTAEAEAWFRRGDLRILEDRVEGLAAAPAAFHRLMSGHNQGKSLVVVSPEVMP